MSDMKCPFCGSPLSSCFRDGEQLFYCSNLTCKAGGFYANDNMWQEFIRTYKLLEITRKAVIHANWFFDGDYNVDAKTMHNEIRCAIKGITTFERRKPVVTHNKIEFPEYKDGLLEEFDKQFLESGQDDNLTETALEQKGCKMIRGKMIECKCAVCSEKFMARVADRNRGWAKCCSKSCAATLSNKKTGKYRKHLACQNKMDNLGYEDVDYYDDSHLFGDE